jgi:RNA polymerase sigma factor (sigma-70 family)
MQPQAASNSGPGELEPAPVQHQISGGYRHLLTALASRAHRFGSRDPEAAAQEALTRSWENTKSKAALEFYFRNDVAPHAAAPAWSLDQLLAWLHVVLRYVVSEERGRVAYRMEVSLDRHSEAWNERSLPEPSDPGANQLHQLLQRELESILSECFPKLDSEYQAVLRLRGAGMKYDEIAVRLGQKENTVATWLSRAIRDLAGCIKRRMQRIGKK